MHDQGSVTALGVPSSLFLLANIWLVMERGNTQGGLLLPKHWTNQYELSQYPIGAVQASADPSQLGKGWMEADGSLLRQVAYLELYTVLGSFYCTTSHPCASGEFRLPNTTQRALSHRIGGAAYAGDAEVPMPSVPTHSHTLSPLSAFEGDCAMPRHKHTWNTESGNEKEQHTHDTTCKASSVDINPGRDASHNHGAPDIKIGTHSSVHRHRHPCPVYSVPSVAFLHPDRAEPKPHCKPGDGDNCNVCKDSNCPHRASARYCTWSAEEFVGGRTPQFTDISDSRHTTPASGTMKSTPSWNTNHADHPSGEDIERPADGSHVHTFSKWDNLEGGGHTHAIPVSARPSPFSYDSLHTHTLTETTLLADTFDNTHTHSASKLASNEIGAARLRLSRSEFDLKYYIKAH
jgi:microcystin-dependent protein